MKLSVGLSNTMLGTRESDTEIEHHLLISVVWMHFLLLLLFIFFILSIILYLLDYAEYEFLSTNWLWQCNVISIIFFLEEATANNYYHKLFYNIFTNYCYNQFLINYNLSSSIISFYYYLLIITLTLTVCKSFCKKV